MNQPTVSMIGLGYIGLPTAGLMASKGLLVKGVDVNTKVVDTINQGKIHIVEPLLDDIIFKVVQDKKLVASTVVTHSEVYLIAVPTPFKDAFEPDLKYVEMATRMIIPVLKAQDLVIIESTSPVGTTEKMQALINQERPELVGQFFMAYCPERVLPGNVIYELEHNDRVIGGVDQDSTDKGMAFYSQFVKGTLHPTNARTAEMCKLVENSSRDVQIAFANELSMICDRAAINVWELIALANKHPRVNILQPGTGVGGHCIAVDPWFIVSAFPEESKIIRSAREINNFKTEWVIEKVKNAALRFELENHRKPIIACMGLAFKPDIDDLRESPAVHVVEALKAENLQLLIVEPNVQQSHEFELTDIASVIEKADLAVFLVAHKEFKGLKLNQIILNFCNYDK